MQQKCYATGTGMGTKIMVTGVIFATFMGGDIQANGLNYGVIVGH
jgi:hypothetical protein